VLEAIDPFVLYAACLVLPLQLEVSQHTVQLCFAAGVKV
jgi:hypothetical protein